MTQTASDVAIEILRATRDGEDLDPLDLSLIQSAVNGWLTEAGEVAFYALHYRATHPLGYQKPWLNGIEHLTIDHVGYVYWKGRQVEHYNQPWAWSESGQASAQELARRCRLLEERGVPVSCSNAIWNWEEA